MSLYFISGGWLLVSNIVFDNSSSQQLSAETSYLGISNYRTNKMVLKPSAMKELRTHLSFTQLRFHCSKQQGRTFHVTTATNITGEAVVQYFSGQTDVQPNACGSFMRMEDDNSRLAGVCDRWGLQHSGTWGRGPNESRLYNHVAYLIQSNLWMIRPELKKWLCDDNKSEASNGDAWKVFVR